MAGPWEEYKTPNVTVTKIGDREIAPASDTGPWSEYQVKFPESEIPTRRTWREVGQEAITNVLPSGQKVAAGLYQAVTSPVETLSGLGEVLTGAYARFIPQEWMARPDKAQEFIQKANAFGGVYKDRYGSVESLKNTIATDPVGFLADVSTLTGVGGMAAPGRAGQVATTVSRYTDPLRLSGVLPILEKGGEIATRAGGTALRGAKTNVLLEAIEGRGPQIINALRNQPEIVPGAKPTAGEAAVPAGGTRFAALQESAEKVLPSEYRARQLEQDAARAAAVRKIGKTEPELAAAVKARKDEAQLLYGAAGVKPVVEDTTLKSLRARPSVKRAFERAKELAEEEGTSFGSSGNYTAADMHYVKLALDDFTKDPATFGIGKVEASKIGKTKEEFISWLERQVPEYGTARSAFQTRSKPINQMEVGQYLESRLTSALEGEQKLRPAAFATAVEAAPQTIKRATTGGARFEKLSDVLTPDLVKIVEDVRKDLARQSEFRKQAAAARQAGPEAGGAASQTLIDVAGGAQFPTLLNRVTTVANALLKRMAGKIDRKVAIEIATDMLDPERTALAIEAAQRRAGVVSAFGQPIRAAGRGAVRLATPAATTTNALIESQNQNALRSQ
jgi:hypothetical protein